MCPRRRWSVLVVAGIVAVVGVAAAVAVMRDDRSVSPRVASAEVFAAVASGVGLVQLLDCRGRPFRLSGHEVTGTGFLVGSRVVMTAEHGIWNGEDRIGCGFRVRLSDRWYGVADVKVWRDRGGKGDRRGIDLATLMLTRDAPGHIFEIATRGVPVGSEVAALGHPFGLPLSLSGGVVTAKLRDYGAPALAARIDLEGGSSGGPIINSRGEVISVVRGIIVSAAVTADHTHRSGGLDLVRWWGGSALSDLCRAHPTGGIPNCDDVRDQEPLKVARDVPRAK